MDWLSPYKGLAPFEDSELDAAFFFGREREQGVITANLTAARLTLLYGSSGAGKSSILRAGVVRRLRALPGPLAVVLFDDWRGDPGRRLREEVAATAGVGADGSLADTLEAASARLAGELYVILDGAEEYFVYHGDEHEPGTFAADFPDAVTRPGLRAYFLLALREDALAALDPFKSRIPSLYANSVRLEHLDRHAAREAIDGPLEQYNRMTPEAPVGIEPELVEAVLDQVATGKVGLGGAGRGAVDGGASGGRVETPYLSLVMERLWQTEQAAGSRLLRMSTLEALGGAEQIVRDHLDDALELLPAESREAAAEMFNHLVTPSGTKIAHSVSDLAEYASVREGELEPVLQTLASERILRPVAGDGGSGRYEIFHDVLANAVLAWRSAYATRRALEAERKASHRRVRRLLVVIAVALVALVAMVAVTIFALAQRNDARTQRNVAQTQRNVARTQARLALARELSADALINLPSDPELSLLLALEAAKRERSPAVADVLRQGVDAVRARAVLPTGGKPVHALAFSPRGRTLAVGGDDGWIRIFTVGGRPLRKLRQGGAVTSVSFSPDGKLLLTAGKDGSARLWRARDGKALHVLRHRRAVESALFSSDGSLVVTAGDDRTARIWRTADGAPLQVLRHPHTAVFATFDPRAQRLATVSGGQARIFDVASGRELLRLSEGGVTSVAFSPDGTLIATGSTDHTARLWRADTGAPFAPPFDHQRTSVLDVAFTQLGDRLVTAGSDGSARVWGVTNRAGQRIAVIGRHLGAITSISLSPAEPEEPAATWVVTASRDGTAKVSKSEGAPWATLLGHTGPITTSAFSPNGRLVATGSEDGTARVWDAGTYPRLASVGTHGRSANTASFSPDGTLVVSAGDDGTARIWNVRQRRLVARLPHRAAVEDVQFSSHGKVIVTASRDGTARLWTSTGHPLRTLRHRGPVATAAFSRDGRLVVTASSDGTARIWRVADGKQLQLLQHPGAVTKAAFSPDGRFVVTTSGRTGRIWRTADGDLLRLLRGHRGALVDASFSPDGREVVTASADATARLWNTRTGRTMHELKGHRRALTSAEFSPDGTLVVTTSIDTDGRVWNARTGAPLHVLGAHFAPVRDAAFSPDGHWIVTAGPSAARLWFATTGIAGKYLFGSRYPLRSAAFSPDSRRIVSAGADGAIRIYLCETCGTLAQLEALARRRLGQLGRSLSPAERAKYLHRG